MKQVTWQLTILIVVCFFPALVIGQSATTIFKKVESKPEVTVSWFSCPVGKFVVDFRHNFDQGETFGLFVGYRVVFEVLDEDADSLPATLTFVPMLGVLNGPYDGISPQLVTTISRGQLNAYILNQYSASTCSRPDFAYHLLEMSWTLKKVNWLTLGVGEQLYHEVTSGFKTEVDIGPQIKVTWGRAFAKLWYSWGG